CPYYADVAPAGIFRLQAEDRFSLLRALRRSGRPQNPIHDVKEPPARYAAPIFPLDMEAVENLSSRRKSVFHSSNSPFRRAPPLTAEGRRGACEHHFWAPPT